MSPSSIPEPDPANRWADISRARWLGPFISIYLSIYRWLWVVGLLLIAAVVYFDFASPRHPERLFPPGWMVPIILSSSLLFWLFVNRFTHRWLRLAQRPIKELMKGNGAVADVAYQKALARARRYSAGDYRGAVMLFELANYLMNRVRRKEAQALFEESLAILEKNVKNGGINYFIALNNYAIFLLDGKAYQAAQEILERAVDLIPALKKIRMQCPEMELILHLNLTFLFLKFNNPHEAKPHLEEAEKLFTGLGWLSRRSFRDLILSYRAL
jgi:tetratricopeptide (TPR) repeat protein